MIEYQHGLLRFVENHDEPRAVSAFGSTRSRVAAVTALTQTGARLVHNGQLRGSDGAPSGVSWPIPIRADRSRFDHLLPLVPDGCGRSDLPKRSLAALRPIRLAWR